MHINLATIKTWTLKGGVNRLEDAIITISGPALAISGIIAGLDLITGGTVLKDSPQLGMTWAICLLITLDFQVLAFGVRAHRIYRRQDVGAKGYARKALELLLCLLVAGAISYVSIQMQSVIARVNADKNTTVVQAERALGVDGNALIWERSTLVLVLIFLSGWSRGSEEAQPAEESDSQRTEATPAQVQVIPPPPALDIEALVRALDERADHKLEVMVREVRATLEQVTSRVPALPSAPQPALPTPRGEKSLDHDTEMVQGLSEEEEDTEGEDRLAQTIAFLQAHPGASDEDLARHIRVRRPASARFWRLKALENLGSIFQADSERTPGAENLPPIFQGQFESKEQAILQACRLNPGASPEQIAQLVHCTSRTAEKWMQRHQVLPANMED